MNRLPVSDSNTQTDHHSPLDVMFICSVHTLSSQLLFKQISEKQSTDVLPSLSCICLCLSLTEANVSSVVSKGYIFGLMRLYEDWHRKDTQHIAVTIRHTLLRCLHKVTHSTAGRQAFVSQGGIRLLYETTQVKFKSPLTWGLSVSPSLFFLCQFFQFFIENIVL